MFGKMKRGKILIFISGVHGVGKTFFAKMLKEKYDLNTYTASSLISNFKNCELYTNKKVVDIEDNQKILLFALEEMSKDEKTFLLDGHFCLLDADNNITRIDFITYEALQPKAIVLLTEEPKVIVKRRKERDGFSIDINSTKEFQDEEIKYAKEVADRLQISLFISNGVIDLDNTMEFIMNNI